ncbi:MAG: PEP-CTERM sorting domain-containing protein [Myxococcota bacterium]
MHPIVLGALSHVGFFGINSRQTLGSYTVVPEPTTASLLALDLLGLAMRRRT